MIKTLSECFNDEVRKRCGCGLDEVFNGIPLDIEKAVYTDPAGNVASRITTSLRSENPPEASFFINSKPVCSLPADVLARFKIVDDFYYLKLKLLEPLVIGTEYPKLNIGFDTASKGLSIEANVAGIEEQRITVSFEENYLEIRIEPEKTIDRTEEEVQKESIVYLQKEFRDTRVGFDKRIFIDTAKFSVKDLRYQIILGKLQIFIPKKDSSAEKIIFKPSAKPKSKSSQKNLNSFELNKKVTSKGVMDFIAEDESLQEKISAEELEKAGLLKID